MGRKEIERVTIDMGKLADKMFEAVFRNEEKPKGKIPRLHIADESEFKPSFISIGPYYRNTVKVDAGKDRKLRHLYFLVRRNRRSDPKKNLGKDHADNAELEKLKDEVRSDLEKYSEALKNLKEEVKSFYTDFEVGDDDCTEMMLLDGCFIVEYFLRIREGDDELIGNNYLRQQIEYDMLLLENQLPFSVLQCIYNLAFEGRESPFPLSQIIIRHFILSSVIQIKPLKQLDYSKISPPENIYHLFHLFHSVLVSVGKSEFSKHFLRNQISKILKSDFAKPIKCTWNCFKGMKNGNQRPSSIRSATELEEAGITFKKGSGISVVTFHRGYIFRRGTIEIPPLLIDKFTKRVIQDLLLFEKLDPDIKRPEITAYAKFFDNIINTSSDVALLRKKGIIDHSLGSDDDVATFFNDLGGINYCDTPDYLKRIYEGVHEYCSVKFNHDWASLMRNYFSSPWSFIKVAAAAILLFLTAIQTFYSVYAYYRRRGS